MCRYRQSACRAATRHDDDDDRRAPVSMFVIVSSSSSPSSLSSLLFHMIGRPRGITAISIFPFTYARLSSSTSIILPPMLARSIHHCCHHLLRPPPSTRRFTNRRPLQKGRTIRSVYARDRLPRASVVHAARMEFPKRSSCGLRRTTSSDITDRRYARKHSARALPLILPPRLRERRSVSRRRKGGETRDALCVTLATSNVEDPQQERERERT